MFQNSWLSSYILVCFAQHTCTFRMRYVMPFVWFISSLLLFLLFSTNHGSFLGFSSLPVQMFWFLANIDLDLVLLRYHLNYEVFNQFFSSLSLSLLFVFINLNESFRYFIFVWFAFFSWFGLVDHQLSCSVCDILSTFDFCLLHYWRSYWRNDILVRVLHPALQYFKTPFSSVFPKFRLKSFKIKV